MAPSAPDQGTHLAAAGTHWLTGGGEMGMAILARDGRATLPRLRELCPDLPVLVATGRTGQAAQDLVAHFTAVALLAKPFDRAVLKAKPAWIS